jgi:hypothetical protein
VLFELAHQARHFAPVAQALLGAHAQAQGGDVAALARKKLLQGGAGIVETAVLEGELGFRHQPGGLQAGAVVAAHARRPFRRTLRVTQA